MQERADRELVGGAPLCSGQWASKEIEQSEFAKTLFLASSISSRGQKSPLIVFLQRQIWIGYKTFEYFFNLHCVADLIN